MFLEILEKGNFGEVAGWFSAQVPQKPWESNFRRENEKNGALTTSPCQEKIEYTEKKNEE